MYAIKSNKERIDVRKYASAFIPSYTSAAEESIGKKLFVVPGYIFLPKMISGAEKVPPTEWNVIEALSDSHPSTFNTKTKQITDGPLSGLLILRVNPSLKSVCIRAKLLGVTRDYWLAVRFSTPTPNDPEKVGQDAEKVGGDGDGKAANVVELKDSNAGEAKKMAKATYTEEEINAAIELAKEIGIHKAAKELGLPWQAVMSAAKKAGVEIEPKVSKKKKTITAPEPATSTPAKTNAEKNGTGKNEAGKNGAGKNDAGKNEAEKNDAEKNAVEEKPVEKPKRGRKKKAVYEVVPTTPTEGKKAEKQEEKAGAVAASELEIENAVLRKENDQLKAKIEKLEKALADLI